MNKANGKTFWNALLFAFALIVAGGTASCKMDDDDSSPPDYPRATAAVDYSSAGDPGKAVFIDFSNSDAPTRSLPHDFFDLAIFSTGSGQGSTVHIIANSGNYGTGVQALKTDSTDIADDFSSQSSNIDNYTFKDGKELYDYQSEANPLAGATAASATKNVCLVKVQYGSAEAVYFKVVFNSYGPMGQYTITVVPGLGAGDNGKAELTGGLSGINDDNGYGLIFFDLHGAGGPRALNDGTALKEGVTVKLPKAAEWDLLCTRTDDLTGDATRPKANRSSILLNPVKGTQAATFAGKHMEAVLTASGLFSAAIDAIGYGWYQTDNRGAYWIDPVTFVVKTAEGCHAKFQPATFQGPNGESFHMDFRYYYADNDTGVFDK
jgi:hypothetical protein